MPRPVIISVLAIVFCAPVFAQPPRPAVLTATASSAAVRYAAFGEVREIRVEVFDEDGSAVFDSSFSRGNLLDYGLTDRAGGRLADGSYLFVVTMRDLDNGLSQRFGAFRVAGRRVTLSNGSRARLSPAQTQALDLSARTPALLPIDEIGVDVPAEMQPPVIVVEPASASGPATAIPRSDVAGTGTTNRLTKWTDTSGTLGDSALSEVGGKVGIGTPTPLSLLHLFGSATSDVFEGIGPNPATGPAMNFGYSGASFGRGAGFFNVRPDASAVAPNPSLRFLTANAQRMIITNLGNIGIGTVAPTEKLEVSGNVKLSGGGALFFNDASSMSTAGATLGSNNFVGDQNVAGSVIATGSIIGSSGFFSGAVTAGAGSFVDGGSQFRIAGQRVLSNVGTSNIFLGDANTAASNTTGNGLTFLGTYAGFANTDGGFNTFVGSGAGRFNTSGGNNSYFGVNAGVANQTGSSNVAVGGSAGSNGTAYSNSTFVGQFAGFRSTGGDNTYLGFNAGFSGASATGTNNTAVGSGAGIALSGATNTVLVGKGAGGSINTGNGNTLVGSGTAPLLNTGASNTVVGFAAGQNLSGTNSNTTIGAFSDAAAGISNATAIGASATVTQSNSLVLGPLNPLTSVGIGTTAPKQLLEVAGGAVYISTAGQAVILKSPGGTCYKVTVTDAGALTTASLTCP